MITKAAFLEKYAKDNACKVDDLLRDIMAELENRWDGHRAIVQIRHFSQAALEMAMTKMRAAGWTVVCRSDQRDGDFLEIT